MLDFRLHHYEIDERHYLLLPKLNRPQMETLASLLEGRDFDVRLSSVLEGKRKDFFIRIDPAGFSYSWGDPLDLLGPMIPEIIKAKKVKTTVRRLRGFYYDLLSADRTTIIKFHARIESALRWDALRALGVSALSPDEKEVLLSISESSEGSCRTLTDFPMGGSRVKIVGGKQYYDSNLSFCEFAASLPTAGEKANRNSYLPRNGVLEPDMYKAPSNRLLSTLFSNLGEWCFFETETAKTLIDESAGPSMPR